MVKSRKVIVVCLLACGLVAPAAGAQQRAFVNVRNDDAKSVLEKLPIKGRAAKTGYTRKQFGTAWEDVDHNGCDTRNDILKRDFTHDVFKSGTANCKVIGGDWTDVYTGDTYHFIRQPSLISIDHVVSLSDAWQKGAQKLTAIQRKAFANDPLNLIPTSKRVNSQKSDSDAASWLPPNKSFRCKYIARQIAVKRKYGLWVTQAEHDVMARILNTTQCANTSLPNGQDPVR